MAETFDIKVENKLRKEKRGINVYHHSSSSAHIISFDSSIKIPLNTVEEDDYLHISVVSGPGNLWQACFIIIPSWADFEFSTEVKVALTHSGSRTTLKIQPGPPTWQLKMTRPTKSCSTQTADHIIIGDEKTGGGS